MKLLELSVHELEYDDLQFDSVGPVVPVFPQFVKSCELNEYSSLSFILTDPSPEFEPLVPYVLDPEL